MLAREHSAARACERGEQLELVVGEHAPLAAHRHFARGEVELEPPHAEPIRGGGGARASQHGADPRQQLAGVEGLGEVVVRSHFEADHLVHVLALGREHDDGQPGPLGRRADLAADLEAVHAR